MTKEEKKKFYKPRMWGLYRNGELIRTYSSHASAKKGKHFKIVESYEDWLDCIYEIKPL